MKMENSFSKIMGEKSDEALQKIIEHQSDYTYEALQAVIWELEKRGIYKKGEIVLEDQPEVEFKEEPSEVEEAMNVPKLYSKVSIFGFTIFFSTIFGAFLLMQNFTKMGQFKARNQVLWFGIVFTLLNFWVIGYLPPSILTTLTINILGYLILSELFWNKVLGKDIVYEKKAIQRPLAISILIVVLFVILQIITMQLMPQ